MVRSLCLNQLVYNISFNPCFIGFWARRLHEKKRLYYKKIVSILVLLDSGRGDRINTPSLPQCYVSILVLLDSGRGDDVAMMFMSSDRLFQSLFYWILGAEYGKNQLDVLYIGSFNPCFIGFWARSLVKADRSELVPSFNPCFIGFWARRI